MFSIKKWKKKKFHNTNLEYNNTYENMFASTAWYI